MFVIHRRRSIIPALLVAVVLAMLTISPALADTELGHTGTVGFHQLRDTDAKPGVKCTYKRINPSPGGYSYEGKLKMLEVRPPKVRASAGTQQVGWRFEVQRQRYFFSGTPEAWRTTYRSPIQRATTNTSRNASFGWKSINVVVPSDQADAEPNFRYRVQIKMFWYGSGGATQGTALHGVDYYREIFQDWPIGTPPNGTTEDYCEGWSAWEIA